ncbi:hypothetical protein HYH03_014256 [Edaphochlamys debaryana]|uniref:Uncharacterized protein n=1 Tax=Edaphochlamys debaryana TaxID=47281 RepID=A0A835XN60_9CHLO|nr:hypothetical protein HYH03_014256 [Edaphochlamys debaryana]|eukprot:KAG2487143.1 hypothetical protein HYH03_014256 [Edaphochlamys debaryana]
MKHKTGSVLAGAPRHPLLARALAESRSSGRVVLDLSASTPAGINFGDQPALISAALAALAEAGHPLASLSLLGLCEPLRLPEPATLAFLCSCGLSELQLSDVSAKRAEADGAANLLRPAPPTSSGSDSDCEGGGPVVSLADSIRTRGSAMLRFAAALPQLKRLTACSAAFPAADVSALVALSGLEELSLSGAMECAPGPGPTPGRGGPCGRSLASAGRQGPAAVASATYQGLLAALPRLRRLALPMALASQEPSAAYGTRWGAPTAASSLYDSSDDEDCGPDPGLSSGYTSDAGASSVQWTWGGLAGGGGSGGLSGTPTPRRGTPPSAPASARSRSAWRFPPGLEEMTLPLCALNAPLFHALCCEYGSDRYEHGGVCGTEASYGDAAADGASLPYAGLKALHVTCAPGYSSWEGSFLKTEADFAALSRLTGLETLHLALELGAPGGPRRATLLRAAFARLRALPNIRELRISETRLPLCFTVCKPRTSAPPPALADVLGARAPGASSTAGARVRAPPGYSGLSPARIIFPFAAPLPPMPQLSRGLPVASPASERAGAEPPTFSAWSSFSTPASASHAFTSPTHSRGAQTDSACAVLRAMPRPFPSPPPLASAVRLPPQQTRSPFVAPVMQVAVAPEQKLQGSGTGEPPCLPPVAALQPLLSSWPRLQRLTFFSQVVVRVPGPAGADGDRLVFPTSIQELTGGV